MKVVIPYRLDEHEGLELRYAIRSMVACFTDFSGVVLIGDKPSWYRGDHTPAVDIPDEKEKSMMEKVLLSPEEVFLYSNDDFLALERFDKWLPYYWNHNCRYMAQHSKDKRYKDMYENCLPDWRNYDIHTPCVIHKFGFERAYDCMESQRPIKTMYINDLPVWHRESVRLTDCKISGEHTQSEINFIIKGRPFWSTHNNAINQHLINTFSALYSSKSKYEASTAR